MNPDSFNHVNRILMRDGANPIERGTVMHCLTETAAFDQVLAKFPEWVSDPSVKSFHESVHVAFEKMDRLIRHASRTSHRNLRAYLTDLTELRESFIRRGSEKTWDSVLRQSRVAERVYSELQRGTYDDGFGRVTHNRVQEALAKDAEALIKQIGKSNMDYDTEFEAIDADLEKTHDAFVKALEKEFSIKVHHWEPIREGVMVFLDAENTEELIVQLKSYNDQLNRVTDELGYVLLRRGLTSDITFGSFPKGCSKWVFVHCPETIDDWSDPAAQSKVSDELQKDTDKQVHNLITRINALPLE